MKLRLDFKTKAEDFDTGKIILVVQKNVAKTAALPGIRNIDVG